MCVIQKAPCGIGLNKTLSCRIASVMSNLCENEAQNLQNGDFHLAEIPDFGMTYLENHLAC